MEASIEVRLQRLSDQIERLISDATSEKITRKQSNDRVFSRLDGIDALLRGKDGNNGLTSRVKTLETSVATNHKALEDYKKETEKKTFNSFNRWSSIIAIAISIVALFIKTAQ